MNSCDGLVRAADDLDGLAQTKRGLEKAPHQRRGQDVRDPDHEPQRLPLARPLSVSRNSRPSEKISSA